MTEQSGRQQYPEFTRELVAGGLRELGLGRGDRVFVHSSLKDLAPARQLLALPQMGMPAAVEGIREAVGPEGLIALPAFSFCFARGAIHRGRPVIFSRQSAPSRVGDLTNYFRQLPGVVRSAHPTHSVAAWGERAEEFVAHHRWDDGPTFNWDSPWGKLCDWDFYILFFGTHMFTCTLVHAVEEWMQLPYLCTEQALVMEEDTRDVRVAPVTGSPSGCREFYNNRGTKVENAFLATDIYRSGRICMAEVTLFKARDFVRFLWAALKSDPWLLLHRDPADQFCWTAGQATARHLATFDRPSPC